MKVSTFRHRWARLLKQQWSITFIVCQPWKTDFRFPLPILAFSANKRKFARFCFPFVVNKQKLPFSVSSVFSLQTSWNMEMETLRHGLETWSHGHGDMKTWRRGDMKTWRHVDMETWRHGDMETWRHGDMKTWRHGDMETWSHADMEIWRHPRGNGSPDYFPKSIYRLLFKQTEVCRLPVGWRRNIGKLPIWKRT